MTAAISNTAAVCTRKVADYVYISAVSKDDPVFEETRHLAQVLELPEKLQRLADNGAKKVAYFSLLSKNNQWRITSNNQRNQ